VPRTTQSHYRCQMKYVLSIEIEEFVQRHYLWQKEPLYCVTIFDFVQV